MTAVDKLIEGAAWRPVEAAAAASTDVPVATHSAEVELFGRKVRVFRLSTGQAVIEQGDMLALLGIVAGEGVQCSA